MKAFYWFTRFSLSRFFHLLYRCKVYGTEHPVKGRAIIAPNHTSFFDPPIIAIAWPEEVHFLAKASLFQTSYMKWLIKKLNAHPVNESAQDIKSMKTICKLLEEEKKVVIFPEGERSHHGDLLSIKSGVAMLALRMKCPIIPAYIEGAYEAWPRNSRLPKFGNKITILFGKPIAMEPYLHMHKKEAQQAISEHLLEEIRKLKHKAGSLGK